MNKKILLRLPLNYSVQICIYRDSSYNIPYNNTKEKPAYMFIHGDWLIMA